jgi:hypothetical protein
MIALGLLSIVVRNMMRYEIRVQGHMGQQWSRWFDDLTVEQLDDGSTCLRGTLPDHAALYGLLDKVRDLGMTLLSVQHVDANEEE